MAHVTITSGGDEKGTCLGGILCQPEQFGASRPQGSSHLTSHLSDNLFQASARCETSLLPFNSQNPHFSLSLGARHTECHSGRGATGLVLDVCQQGETTSRIQVRLPGYFPSWTEVTFYDVCFNYFWLRTGIFSGESVTQGGGGQLCLTVTHGHDIMAQDLAILNDSEQCGRCYACCHVCHFQYFQHS